MKKQILSISSLENQNGAAAVLIAAILPILIAMAAFAIDVGYMYATRNELQNIADAAALAAAGELGNIYQGMSYEEQQDYVCDPTSIIAMANEVVANYQAEANTFLLNDDDIIIGTWNTSTFTFTPTLNQPDAVRVIARRDDTLNGHITAFFAPVFKLFGAESPENILVRAFATAALTGQSTAEPGELELPVGVSRKFFDDPDTFCGSVIKFSPTTDPDACAGWNTFTDSPANNSKVKNILEGLIENPFVQAGESEFEFINGNLSEGTFEELMSRFEEEGHDVDAIYDPDTPGIEPANVTSDSERVPLCDYDGEIAECLPADVGTNQLRYPPCTGAGGCNGDLRYAHEWETSVPVYDSDDCTPSGAMPIAGFAQVVVYNVGHPSNSIIQARILCDYVEDNATRGGGGNYGIKGSIPGLVE